MNLGVHTTDDDTEQNACANQNLTFQILHPNSNLSLRQDPLPDSLQAGRQYLMGNCTNRFCNLQSVFQTRAEPLLPSILAAYPRERLQTHQHAAPQTMKRQTNISIPAPPALLRKEMLRAGSTAVLDVHDAHNVLRDWPPCRHCFGQSDLRERYGWGVFLDRGSRH